MVQPIIRVQGDSPLGTGGLAIQTSRNAKLSDPAVEAPAHHEPVARLVDEERTGDAREGRRTDKHGDPLGLSNRGGRLLRCVVLD